MRRNNRISAKAPGHIRGFRFRSDGTPVVNTRLTQGMTRDDFLRRAGLAGAGVVAAGLGLGGVAHAVGTTWNVPADGDIKPVIEGAGDGDVVYVHPGTYDIGFDTIVIDKSVTVIGIADAYGKPVIIGSNNIRLSNPNCGVIYLDEYNAGKNVEINNLIIEHNIVGSASQVGTIVNHGSNSYKVIDCDIYSNAQSILPHPRPSVHNEVIIRGCTLQGQATTDSCINMGSWGTPGLMKNIEITDNIIDSGKFVGITLFGHGSDSNTNVLIDNNIIGFNVHPSAPGTAIGIWEGYSTLATGNHVITNNRIRCSYSYRGNRFSFGIATHYNLANAQINDNQIEMAVELPTSLFFIGIWYEGANSGGGVSGNTITNTARNPDVGMQFSNAHNMLVTDNDLRGMTASECQVRVDGASNNNEFKNNDYGPVDVMALDLPPIAGLMIHGDNNRFVNENFWGNYPGIYGVPVLPCIWLTLGTFGNTITALKNGQALQGFDVCTQILNEGNNLINGYDKCENVPQHVIDAMVQREQDFINRKKTKCTEAGGSWDELYQTCIFEIEE